MLLVALLLAGCSAAPAIRPTPAQPPAPRPAARIDALAPPALVGTVAGYAEPNLAVDRQGRVFVTDPQSLALWRSDDAQTFQLLGQDPCTAALGACPAPSPTAPASWLRGGSDGALTALPDGTLAWAGLDVPHVGPGAFGVPVQTSRDGGATWDSQVHRTAGGPGEGQPWANPLRLPA
ncbi:MAG: hypothetical protein QOE90_1722 [Thermoplasmata archaeon]|nr:hypothetical protein [Thermoplasmata archaeon]